MKKMQSVMDDDFDKMFRDKLYSYETKPANDLWAGITKQLDTEKPAKSFPILRLAAASMAATIGFGMWLAANNEPIKLSGAADNIPVSPKQELRTMAEPSKDIITESRTVKITTVKEREVQHLVSPSKMTVLSKERASVPSVKEANEPDQIVRPSSTEDLTHKENEAVTPKPSEVLALASEPSTYSEPSEPQKNRGKIKSVGGLVNFVVSKVDKRKNKIIQFEDNDEGTMVSSLNLGLLKFQAKE